MNQHQWRTRDGRVVNIRDMTDGHLRNTIRMLERNHKWLLLNECGPIMTYLNNDPPDGAFDCASREFDQMCEMDVSERCPVYERLRAELSRRTHGIE